MSFNGWDDHSYVYFGTRVVSGCTILLSNGYLLSMKILKKNKNKNKIKNVLLYLSLIALSMVSVIKTLVVHG